MSKQAILQNLSDSVTNCKRDLAISAANEALAKGVNPIDAINEGLVKGMSIGATTTPHTKCTFPRCWFRHPACTPDWTYSCLQSPKRI